MRKLEICIIIIICLCIAAFSCVAPGSPVNTGPLSGTSLYADVVRYASFANHQTASQGDIATSEWIAAELNKAGLKAELKPFKLRQFILSSCELNVDGAGIESFPGWFPNDTPVTGALALCDEADTSNLKGKIAYCGLRYGAVYNTGGLRLVERVRDAGAIGLVVACKNMADTGLLVAANAEMKGSGPEYYQAPLPIPMVLIAGDSESKLVDAAQSGKSASIKITGESKEVTANNVVGILKGGNKWVIVTTPVSGWFQCGGERGPGVALFLGLARWIAKNNSKYSYIFIGNSGHELAYMGAHYAPDEYFPAYGINKDNVACWFHLGSGIACRTWQKTGGEFVPQAGPNEAFMMAAVLKLLAASKASFGEVPGLAIRTGYYAGELSNIVKWGYTSCGFFGSNYFLHTRMDSEKETDPDLLEPFGQGLIKFFVALESLQ